MLNKGTLDVDPKVDHGVEGGRVEGRLSVSMIHCQSVES